MVEVGIRIRRNKKKKSLHFFKRFAIIVFVPQMISGPKYICRCDGIGRRDGLKIRWANHPCGFESHHRHQKSMARKPSNIKGLRAFPFFALSLTNCGGLSFFEMSLLFSGCFLGDITAHSVGKTEIIAFAEAIFEEKSRWV